MRWNKLSIYIILFNLPKGIDVSTTLALITFPNSPSPIVFSSERSFLGISHFRSIYRIKQIFKEKNVHFFKNMKNKKLHHDEDGDDGKGYTFRQ